MPEVRDDNISWALYLNALYVWDHRPQQIIGEHQKQSSLPLNQFRLIDREATVGG